MGLIQNKHPINFDPFMRGGPQIWLYYFLLPVPGCKMILLVTPRILEIKADHQFRTDSRIPDAWKTEQHLPDPTQRGRGLFGEGSQASWSLASYVSQPSIRESIIWGTRDRVQSSHTRVLAGGGQCDLKNPAATLPECPRPSFRR